MIEERLKKVDKATEQALTTWYEPDHLLHLDPLHPAIGLAGEAGECLDLYKKERFKDGVSWWDCVCGFSKPLHDDDGCVMNYGYCPSYTPKILDELGDLWYYLRILAYQRNYEFRMLLNGYSFVPDDMFMILANLNYQCARLLTIYEDSETINLEVLQIIFEWFQDVQYLLDCTLDQLTELNWQKLKGGDNHGWKSARTLG